MSGAIGMHVEGASVASGKNVRVQTIARDESMRRQKEQTRVGTRVTTAVQRAGAIMPPGRAAASLIRSPACMECCMECHALAWEGLGQKCVVLCDGSLAGGEGGLHADAIVGLARRHLGDP